MNTRHSLISLPITKILFFVVMSIPVNSIIGMDKPEKSATLDDGGKEIGLPFTIEELTGCVVFDLSEWRNMMHERIAAQETESTKLQQKMEEEKKKLQDAKKE